MSTACLLAVAAACLGQSESRLEIPSFAKSAVPTVEDLCERMPVIDSTKKKWRSIELAGRFKQPGVMDLRFRAVYREPGRFSLLIRDGSDGTPLLFAVDHEVFVYDPIGPVVYHSAATGFAISAHATEDRQFAFGVFASLGKFDGRMFIDARALLGRPAAFEDVVPTGPGTYLVTKMVEGGDRHVFAVDLSRPCPLTKYEVFADGGQGLEVCLDRIVLDGEVNDGEFALPERERLEGAIAVEDLPAENMLATLGGIGAAMRAAYVRMAAHQPALRDGSKFPGRLGIRWDRVREHDARSAGAMRELIRGRAPLPEDDPPAVPTPTVLTPEQLKEFEGLTSNLRPPVPVPAPDAATPGTAPAGARLLPEKVFDPRFFRETLPPVPRPDP